MPRKNHTKIICIIDRSGSMSSIKDDAIGGFNQFLEEQKDQPGTGDVTLVLFDDQYEVPYEDKELSKVRKLTDKTFVPRGMTALHDAVGRTIQDTQARIDALPKSKKPAGVMVCILTDGHENNSRKFVKEEISRMIRHQEAEHNWKFAFLAANQDAFAEGASLGITRDACFNFDMTAKGVSGCYGNMSAVTTCYRTSISSGSDTDGSTGTSS